MQRKGNTSALLVGMQIGAATVGNSMEFLKKLKMELTHDPVIPLLGIYPKKPQNTNSKEYMHPYVYCNVIYNSHDLETSQEPISG